MAFLVEQAGGQAFTGKIRVSDYLSDYMPGLRCCNHHCIVCDSGAVNYCKITSPACQQSRGGTCSLHAACRLWRSFQRKSMSARPSSWAATTTLSRSSSSMVQHSLATVRVPTIYVSLAPQCATIFQEVCPDIHAFQLISSHNMLLHISASWKEFAARNAVSLELFTLYGSLVRSDTRKPSLRCT